MDLGLRLSTLLYQRRAFGAGRPQRGLETPQRHGQHLLELFHPVRGAVYGAAGTTRTFGSYEKTRAST